MSNRLLVVGHRGWPARFPDNTLAGLIAATDLCDMVEVDVRRSSDGKLVLSHDPSIAGLPVFSTPWSELAEVDLGEGHHPALLDEALAALPTTPFQLEIKNMPNDPGFEPDHRLALETAERSRPGDIVTGFNPETLAAVRRVFPEVATGQAVPDGYEIDEIVRHCLDAGHRAVVPDHRLLKHPITQEIEVYPWTVNEPGRVIELAELGVTGIIGDDPGMISTTLRGRP